MAFARTRAYRMDRRQLLKLTGLAYAGSLFLGLDDLVARELCEAIDLETDSLPTAGGAAAIQYWVDGLHFGEATDLPSRANLAFFINLKQSAVSHVEAVVLVGPDGRALGARYFDASMKRQDGGVPYAVFENLTIDPTRDYTIVYAVRSGSYSRLYTATIAKPRRTALGEAWLPAAMRNDFARFLLGPTPNPTPGLATGPYQFYTMNGLPMHSARGLVKEIGSDGSFQVDLDFMHEDLSAHHFMRYFIVMDPVGRILGFHKRAYGPSHRPGDSKCCMQPVYRITEALEAEFNVDPLQIADIRDCPYVQIFTEDTYDALARATIRLV